MGKAQGWNLSKLTYILLSLIGILLIILLILGTCTDTFKSVATFKLPVLTPQTTSRLGTRLSLGPPKGLSELQIATIPMFRKSYENPSKPSGESSGESSSGELLQASGELSQASGELSQGWLPALTLFTPNKDSSNVPKEPSLYSRLQRASNSGILK